MGNGAKHKQEEEEEEEGGKKNQNVAVHLASHGGSERQPYALQCGSQMKTKAPMKGCCKEG